MRLDERERPSCVKKASSSSPFMRTDGSLDCVYVKWQPLLSALDERKYDVFTPLLNICQIIREKRG